MPPIENKTKWTPGPWLCGGVRPQELSGDVLTIHTDKPYDHFIVTDERRTEKDSALRSEAFKECRILAEAVLRRIEGGE